MGDQVAGTDPGEVNIGIAGFDHLLEVGRGGFSVVYRAHQVEFGRWVALKVITSSLDDRAQARFERERRTIGALTGHPNIVTVFSSGFNSYGLPYIVMEYLAGGSLADRLPDQPFEWREAAALMVKVAGAVAAAHEIGVLHRDIKPENVFLSGHGEPKLGDFGIARLEGMASTSTGVVTASIAHAAPEIIDGGQPTVQADVYALGSTLFALINGWPAHVRPTDPSLVPVLARIVSQPIPDLRPVGVGDALCEVLEQTMAKDPADRFATAAAFASALHAAISDTGSPITPPVPQVPRSSPLQVPAAPAPVTMEVPAGNATTNLGAPNPDLVAAQPDNATTSLGAPNPELVAGTGLAHPTVAVSTPPVAGHEAGTDQSPAPAVTRRKRKAARWYALAGLVVVVVAALVVAGVVVIRSRSSRSFVDASPLATAAVPTTSKPVVLTSSPVPIPAGEAPALYRPPGKTRYVLATSQGLYASPDGQTFDLVQSTPYLMESVAAGPSGWVAVGVAGMYASSDGVTWRSVATQSYDAVATDGHRWVAIGSHGVAVSDDGTRFVEMEWKSGGFNSLATNGKGWVAVGKDGLIRTSIDGQTWATATAPNNADLRVVLTNGSKWRAFGDKNVVLGSDDGVTWTPGTMTSDEPETILSGSFHDRWRVGGRQLWSSADGDTWMHNDGKNTQAVGYSWDGETQVYVTNGSLFAKLDPATSRFNTTSEAAGPPRDSKDHYVFGLAVAGPVK